jgi:DNA transposition AAA+ family ATPase
MVTNIMKAMAPGEGAHGELAAFFAARPDVTLAQFGQYTTLADSTMRHFWNARLGSVEVEKEIRRVLDLARAGEILQPGGGRSATALVVTESAKRARRVARAGNFYKTQTVVKISEVLNYCAEECEIGVVTADYGCGKTEAVAAWRRSTAGSIESMVFEFDEFSASNKVDFLARLAGQFGLACAKGPQNGGRIFQTLVEYLRENPCLLIFDQCEMVRGRICQVMRQIHDRTHDAGVGMVLLAAPILLTRMLAGNATDLGALTSRVGIYATLSGVSKSEMAAIVKAEGFEEIDESAAELWWRSTGGSMRRLMKSVKLLKAKHAGKRITERTIAGVSGNLWGMAL